MSTTKKVRDPRRSRRGTITHTSRRTTRRPARQHRGARPGLRARQSPKDRGARLPRCPPRRPRTASFDAGHAGDQSARSPVEALTFRRTPNHTVPRRQRPPHRATRQRQPSDDPTYPPTSSTASDTSTGPDPPLERPFEATPITVRVRPARAGRPKKSGTVLSDSRF